MTLAVKMRNGRTPVKATVVVGYKHFRYGKMIAAYETPPGEIDLMMDTGLNELCPAAHDSAARPPVWDYVAIGSSNLAVTATQETLDAELYREQGTYAKDAGVGACSMDASFTAFTASHSIYEVGLFNDTTTGTMFCRDVWETPANVQAGDTLNIYYTITYS